MGLTGKQFLAIEWSWVVLTLLLVLTRFRIRYQRRKGINVCDTFVALGWLFFLAQACMDIVLLKKGWFDDKINPEASKFGPEHGLATLQDTITVLKIIYAETTMYYMTMYMIKYAMIFLYYEIIPPHMVALRIATHITLLITFVGGASTFFMKLFWCQPIRSNWSVAGGYCENLTNVFNTSYEWAFHIFTDLLIYIIPLFIVRGLQLPLAQKIGVALTFACGFICIVFANLVQVSYIVHPAPFLLSWTYSAAEMTYAILCPCVAGFRIFLTKDVWLGWHWTKRRISRSMSTSRPGRGGSKTESKIKPDATDTKKRQGSASVDATMDGKEASSPSASKYRTMVESTDREDGISQDHRAQISPV